MVGQNGMKGTSAVPPPPKKQKLLPTVDSTALVRAEQLLEVDGDFAGAASIADATLAPMGDLSALAGDLSALSKAALIKGKALMHPLVNALVSKKKKTKKPAKDAFHAPWDLFKLALRLDPENEEAKWQLDNMRHIIHPEEVEVIRPKQPNHPEPIDVLVVGAGASGVGVALMLTVCFGLHPRRVLLVERGDGVGATFRRWPCEMRFISPSFNQQGWTNSFDLNSVAYGTSPAYTLHSEHPTGEQYAQYLCAIAEAGKLRVRTRTEVTAVRPLAEGSGFEVDVAPVAPDAGVASVPPETLRSRYVIWAAGEFQYPRTGGTLFRGAEHCLHNSSVRSWAELPGDDFVIIGGYESGMDAASNLSLCNKRCSVVSSTACWRVATEDPSTELAPYTAHRLRTALASPTPPRLLAPFRVLAVEPQDGGGYLVQALRGPTVEHKGGQHREPLPETKGPDEDDAGADANEVTLRTPQAPMLCTGFEGSVRLGVSKNLFAWGQVAEVAKKGGEDESGEEESGEEESGEEESGEEESCEEMSEGAVEAEGAIKKESAAEGGSESSPLLNEFDESTKTPGLFLVGPAVRHAGMSFCFVYKFRQRFGIVADAIARGLGFNTNKAVEDARLQNMFLDDFTCCKAACGEAC